MGVGLFSLLLALIVAAVFYYELHWSLWPAWLVPINLVTLVIYRFDKWKASRTQNGQGRIPKKVLHFLALAGGSLGAFFGMIIRPRHKTRDLRFQAWFWLIVLIQVGTMCYCFIR